MAGRTSRGRDEAEAMAAQTDESQWLDSFDVQCRLEDGEVTFEKRMKLWPKLFDIGGSD